MELQISTAIVTGWFDKLGNYLKCDVVIVGAGPSGLVCAAELSASGVKTAVIERKLAPGGGMWGGAMLFNQIVVKSEVAFILDKYGISYQVQDKNLYLIDAVEATSALIYNATKSGAAIFNGISVEDIVIVDEKVCGVVVNWTPVTLNQMHVDPLTISAKVVVDGTGHPCEIASILTKKNHVELQLLVKDVQYERSMNAEVGEKACIEHTGQIYPGLFVIGMAACGVSGSNRMGPIFSGMLLSGIKAAKLIENMLTTG